MYWLGLLVRIVLVAFALSAIAYAYDIYRSDDQPLVLLEQIDNSRRAPVEVSKQPRLGAPFWHLHNDGSEGGRIGADIHLTPATRLLSDGSGVKVAVIDGHFNRIHKELRGHWWHNRQEIAGNGLDDDHNGYVDDVRGWDVLEDDPWPFAQINDPTKTHAAVTSGLVSEVAPGARIIPISLLGEGEKADRIAESIHYALAARADLISISVGLSTNDPAIRSHLAAAIAQANEAGVMIVAAAGNDGLDNDPGDASSFYPAASTSENVIGVAASTARDRLWDKSNFGPLTTDLAAPGVKITAPGMGRDGWMEVDGTSAAAPMVAAVGALLLQIRPDLSPAELGALLRLGSDPLRGRAPIAAGRLNADASISLLLATGQHRRRVQTGEVPARHT